MAILINAVCKILKRPMSQVVQLVAQHRIPISGAIRKKQGNIVYTYDKDKIISLKGKIDSDFDKMLNKEK